MKVLKIIILVVVILIAIPLITAIFVKKDYSTEREVVINKPVAEVFEYVKYLKNQDLYSVWSQLDPAMKQTFSGVDGTVGFISAWESEKEDVGSGAQEIKAITEGARIDYELRFLKPYESTCAAWITTEAVADNQTKVKWGISGRMNYPMNIMFLFMDMDKMLGADLQQGLDNLKLIQEQAQLPADTTIVTH